MLWVSLRQLWIRVEVCLQDLLVKGCYSAESSDAVHYSDVLFTWYLYGEWDLGSHWLPIKLRAWNKSCMAISSRCMTRSVIHNGSESLKVIEVH